MEGRGEGREGRGEGRDPLLSRYTPSRCILDKGLTLQTTEDRQTDGRTDRRTTTYSEREREFTFANKILG